jgi:hypothetical protein
MNAVQTESMLRDYAALQERLCEALFDRYPVDDATLLTDLPKRGSLPLGDELWEFERHGTGVCFTRVPTNEIVDVHADPVAHPGGIDAWRLVQYLESKGIETVNYGATKFDATKEKSLDEMLQRLCSGGVLVVADPKRRIYSVHRSQRRQ